MYDKNVIVYLEPAACVSRTLEVQGTKQTRELSLEKDALVLKPQDGPSSATDSETKLHNALVRRGIALQFAKLMSHSVNGRHSCLMHCTEIHPQGTVDQICHSCSVILRHGRNSD